MDLNEVYKNSGLGKWFHGESANKTPGWDRYNSEGKLVGECGDAKKGDSYSACLSKQKAQKLGKEGIASFVKRKRAAQSEAGRGEKGAGGKGQKPINVDTGASKMDECVECNEELELINEGKNKPNDPEKWSACKSAAKSKFDVYPSAYANAWAAKCYKKKGGSWRSVKEEVEDRYADSDARFSLSSIGDPKEKNAAQNFYQNSSGSSSQQKYNKALWHTAKAKKNLGNETVGNPAYDTSTQAPGMPTGVPLILPNIKDKTGKSIQIPETLKEQLKRRTKDSVIFRLFENNKMKDGPGKTPQRPKSFGKGGKSGTEQTQERREGKRQAEDRD